MVALLVCALAFSSAIFLVLELDQRPRLRAL
jgi:hypothetical protein